MAGIMRSDVKSKRSRSVREQAVDWMLRIEDGLSPADQRAFDAWLAQDPAHEAAFDRARATFRDAERAMQADPDRTKRSVRRKTRAGPAAILLACLLLGGGLFAFLDGPLYLTADVVSASDEMPSVDLPDGTRVQLNARSAIVRNYTADARIVTLLAGEGYFEVAADPSRPFIVKAGDLRVEALGTAFNVNLAAGRAEVTVTESTVSVRDSHEDAAVVLAPGMRVATDPDGHIGAVEAVPDEALVPWRSGRLVFEERPLPQVVAELARHLPGRVVVANPRLSGRTISGSFELADPAAALESFAAAFGLTVLHVGLLLTVIC